MADLNGRRKNENIQLQCFAGGAPFNVACCLKKLGAECGFCGCVGADVIGDFLTEIALAQNFDFLKISKDTNRNTTLAFVEVDAKGERKFSFYRKNTADAFLPQEEIDIITSSADIVHIGSLPISTEQGRLFFEKLILRAHEKGKKISFDVNYRSDVFSGVEEAVRFYRKFISKADIIKFSEDELPMFSCGTTLEKMLTDIAGSQKTVLLTLGNHGSMACVAGQIYRSSAIKVQKVEDTNGAGDAFMAGVLASVDAKITDWDDILSVANICGALTVSQSGAYPKWNIEDLFELKRNN